MMAHPPSETNTSPPAPASIHEAINKPNPGTERFSVYTVKKVKSFLTKLLPEKEATNQTPSLATDSRTVQTHEPERSTCISCLKSAKLKKACIITLKVLAITIISLLTVALPIVGVFGICIAYVGLSSGLIIGGVLSALTLPLSITLLSILIPRIWGNTPQPVKCLSVANTSSTANPYRTNHLDESFLVSYLNQIRAYFENEESRSQLADDNNAEWLFNITLALHNLNFLSDLKPYQDTCNSLFQFLEANPELITKIIDLAKNEDKNTVESLQSSLNEQQGLSIEELEKLFHLLSETCPLEKYDDTITSLKTQAGEQLFTTQVQLISEQTQQFTEQITEYINQNKLDADGDSPKQTSQQSVKEYQRFATFFEAQHTDINIAKFRLLVQQGMDILHHIRMTMHLLDRIYNKQGSKIILSSEQRKNINECLMFYRNFRNALVDYQAKLPADNTIPDRPRFLWTLLPIARRLNDSWLINHKRCPLTKHDGCIQSRLFSSDSLHDMECTIDYDDFDEMAPTVNDADNITLLITLKKIFGLNALLRFIPSQAASSESTQANGLNLGKTWQIVDIIPISLLIPIHKFATHNLLPELPESFDFLQKDLIKPVQLPEHPMASMQVTAPLA